MSVGRSEHYRQTFRLPDGAGAMGFLAFWGLAFGSAVLLAPWPVGTIFGVVGWGCTALAARWFWRRLRQQRRGLRADAAGLTEEYWLRAARQIPWSEVYDLRGDSQRATIRLASGERITLDADLPGWQRLARRIEAAVLEVAPDELDTTEVVPPEVIRDWLGIEPDGTLVCRGRTARLKVLGLGVAWTAVTGLLCLLYAPFIGAGLASRGAQRLGMLLFILAHAAIFFSVFSGGLLVALRRAWRESVGRRVVADASGLTVHGPFGERDYAWAELDGIDRLTDGWRVTAGDESFLLPAAGAGVGQLVRALQAAVAARAAGQRLPAGGVLPAGALSLARAGATDAARGLSRSVDAS
ncbi:MAG: PH domain-containing protein [Fimbriimonadaceae bacterium]|nr:PH domain-containing protein [Fimbriimonadaceae bacterium]